MADDLDPSAVERAARALDPAAFDESAWIMPHFEQTFEEAREERQDRAREQARAALAAAGLLVTPEHDAQVAARALREAAAAFLIGRYQPQGVRQSTDAWVRDGQELLDALATWQAARMPSVEQVAEVLAAHQRCCAWTCLCGAEVAYIGASSPIRDKAFARHQAEQVDALWGAL